MVLPEAERPPPLLTLTSTVACWDVEGDLGESHGRVAVLHSALLDEDEDLGHAAVRLVVKELLGHGLEVGVVERV